MTEIQAKKRAEVGKGLASIRKNGAIPAVLYGEGVPSTPLSVLARDFEKVYRASGETSIVTLRVDEDKDYTVLIHDVAVDPMRGEPIHADFYAVRMDRPIEAKVVLSFIGESPAVKGEGGILVKVHHELEVKALPADMPHEIEVHLEMLEKIKDKIHVRDLKLPKGVTTTINTDEVIALVEPPRSEEEIKELETPAEEVVTAEVKTEREVKAEAKAETEAAKEVAEASPAERPREKSE